MPVHHSDGGADFTCLVGGGTGVFQTQAVPPDSWHEVSTHAYLAMGPACLLGGWGEDSSAGASARQVLTGGDWQPGGQATGPVSHPDLEAVTSRPWETSLASHPFLRQPWRRAQRVHG